jgi:hypothetical protein
MPVNSNQYLQGINQTTGTGVPSHSAVAGDRYTDTATGTTYQYTTSWQTVSYSAGGLTYFTEAQATASPNNLVNVDSLTAVASTTNADFVIQPKGSGAIIRQIPDGTTTGGNKRGANAVDFQYSRSAANQVVSGVGGVAFGYNNTISGINGLVMGNTNVLSGDNSYVFGQGNTSLTGYDFAVAFGTSNNVNRRSSFANGTSNTVISRDGAAFGDSNNISADYGYAFGNTNTVSSNAMAIGTTNNASAPLSFCIGSGSYSDTRGKFVSSSGSKGAVGDAQLGMLTLVNRTTDTTPTRLYANVVSLTASTQLSLQANQSIRFKGTIIAKQSGSQNTAAWDIDGIISRGATVGTTVIVGSANVNVVSNIPTWGTPTLTADTSIGCLNISVIGLSATNIQWVCRLDTAEVIYA